MAPETDETTRVDGQVVTAPPSGTPPPPPSSARPDRDTSSIALGIAFWGVAGAVVLAVTAGRSVVFARPWTPWFFAVLLLLVVSVPFWFGSSREWIKKSALRQGALLTFAVAPALLALVLAVVLASPGWQFARIRIGFILVACLTPPSLYYLFVVTRKSSLLNEFLANLTRLGLLTPRVVAGSGPDADPIWGPRPSGGVASRRTSRSSKRRSVRFPTTFASSSSMRRATPAVGR